MMWLRHRLYKAVFPATGYWIADLVTLYRVDPTAFYRIANDGLPELNRAEDWVQSMVRSAQQMRRCIRESYEVRDAGVYVGRELLPALVFEPKDYDVVRWFMGEVDGKGTLDPDRRKDRTARVEFSYISESPESETDLRQRGREEGVAGSVRDARHAQ